MSFLRWGNGGALTDPTSVPAREPSPARNSGKDKFLCPFSSLKKNPHPHPARKRMPSFVTGPNRQPPSSSQTAGERSQPAHIDACSLAYHIPSKRKEEQQSCPRNHPPHCPKSHTPRPRPSSSGGIFSSGAAICFWSRFAKSLETGNKDLYTSEGLVAVCASGLLLAVLLEAARIWRMRRRK